MTASKTKPILLAQVGVMVSLIGVALIWPKPFLQVIERPELYVHAKFVHILTVTLFFANAVIGTLWETRALLSKNPDIIRYTYQTVVWLDAVFTAPLILIAVLSGLLLGTVLGGVWSMNWLAAAFGLFLVSGGLWIALDIPTQYRTNQLFERVPPGATALPPELIRVLKLRVGINLFTLIPLLVIFYLMVHKPELTWLSR